VKLTRRNFLKSLGAGIAAAVLARVAGKGEVEAVAAAEPLSEIEEWTKSDDRDVLLPLEPLDLSAVMKKFPDSEGTIVIRDGMPTWVRMNGQCLTE